MKFVHISLGNGVTWCPDTPENQAHFQRLKDALINQVSIKAKHPYCPKSMNAQLARENKLLRSYRTFIPGYEPDR